jgi:hypothetical protein
MASLSPAGWLDAGARPGADPLPLRATLQIAVLAAAAALLALLSLHLLITPVDTAPIAPPAGHRDAPPPASIEPATALDRKTTEEFRETVARPLFNPSRKPVQRKDAADSGPRAAASDLRLIGVMRSAGQPPRALLRSPREPHGRWIAEGAELNGWMLREVGERSVVLQSGPRSHELKLTTPRRPPANPPPKH